MHTICICNVCFNNFIFLDRPSAPQNFSVRDITENSVSLRWTAPNDDGGCPIMNYNLEKREGNKKMWQTIVTTKDNEFNVPRLIEGNQYVFQVSAENACGVGKAVELDSHIIPRSQFGE